MRYTCATLVGLPSPTYIYIYIYIYIYVEDRYTTQTVLKPSGRFYKWLADFKQAGPI